MRITKLLDQFAEQKKQQRSKELEHKLMSREAQLGGTLFGEVPAGHRREFFCLDTHTWVWYEEWVDEHGITKSQTTRYDVHPDKIVKAQNGQYYRVEQEEARHFFQAVELYKERVMPELYGSALQYA